ncbi:OmpA family protein [Pseudoxanthomonas dokdonensis]|uniref:Membrane protein n=1 Tax=Pseudoxanthomonas dokdonensis TaxID=344882 RepID=A0A0R0CU27_9GAMM|nr:OmpA family protein [Pseudoxanthomonas dokdonensis]KRG69607.1 membrane protein [Pseudoxanthomonas dokdonensis]
MSALNRRHRHLALLLALAGVAAVPLAARESPEATQLNQQLAALQANPDLREMAPYERVQAQQAIVALDDARRRDRERALFIAQRRVEIAEVAARTAYAQQQLHQLDRLRGDLLVEASQRDAARARQEAERMRIQAQIQAEEAERLRQSAEAESLARQDVEATLTTVTGQQTAKLSAAKQKDAKLAREEAELMSGAKLPPSKFDGDSEVFTLGASAFQSGTAKLSASGKTSLSALTAYLQATPKAKARIEGYGEANVPAQKRADAVRDALVAAGIPKSRLSAVAKGNASKSRALVLRVAL